MVGLLEFVDVASFVSGLTFLIFAALIRMNVRLPQNNVLMIVGAMAFLHTFTHLPKYFPGIFPPFLGEDTEHITRDLSLLVTTLALLWYGVTTYMYVRQVKPKYVRQVALNKKVEAR